MLMLLVAIKTRFIDLSDPDDAEVRMNNISLFVREDVVHSPPFICLMVLLPFSKLIDRTILILHLGLKR